VQKAESVTQPAGAALQRGARPVGRRFAYATELRLAVALGALYAGFAIGYPSAFATLNNTTNMARLGGILLVVAVGQMFALLVGGFDLSVAANMGFAATVAALGATEHGGFAPGMLIGLASGAAIGLVNGILIAAVGLSPFIVTLGMLTFLLGFGNQLAHGAPIFGLTGAWQYLYSADWGPFPAPIGIAAIMLALAWLILARTRVGLYVYAIGGSRDTCRSAGVPVAWYEMAAYTVCGTLAGVAGLMVLSRVTIGQVTDGQGYDLLSIAAAVIGGTAIGGGVGRLSGVVMGVALLTVLTTGMNVAGLSNFYQKMVTGAVVVGSVLVSQSHRDALRGFLARFVGPEGWGLRRVSST
jgi:ribose/xylose/arabinose/galactoside ABC-type transport system permease subunit